MSRLWIQVRIYGLAILWLMCGDWLMDVSKRRLGGYTLAALVPVVVIGLYSMNIRCPACRWPVIKTKAGLIMPFVPKNCRYCGRPL